MPYSKKGRKPIKEKLYVRTRELDDKIYHANILKYYRIVMYWAKRNYDLKEADIHLLFFIYDIPLFTKSDFEDFQKMASWDSSRFYRLKTKGWIIKYRRQGIKKAALYRISPKGKRLISSMYRKMKGEESFSEQKRKNVVLRGERSTDNIMAKKMKEINKKNKELARKKVFMRAPDGFEYPEEFNE